MQQHERTRPGATNPGASAQPGSCEKSAASELNGQSIHPPGRRHAYLSSRPATNDSAPVVPRTPRTSIVAYVNLAETKIISATIFGPNPILFFGSFGPKIDD